MTDYDSGFLGKIARLAKASGGPAVALPIASLFLPTALDVAQFHNPGYEWVEHAEAAEYPVGRYMVEGIEIYYGDELIGVVPHPAIHKYVATLRGMVEIRKDKNGKLIFTCPEIRFEDIDERMLAPLDGSPSDGRITGDEAEIGMELLEIIISSRYDRIAGPDGVIFGEDIEEWLRGEDSGVDVYIDPRIARNVG